MNRPVGPDLVERLATLAEPEAAYVPALYDLREQRDREALSDLLTTRRSQLTTRDTLVNQVQELLEVRDPSADVSESFVEQYMHGHGGAEFGVWVYYPWLHRLVRTLPKAEFRELRTSRNRYKITPDEQHRLAAARLGIVGLSVGHSIAVCMALEGIGGSFRLADFDVIELSNTNRIACGLPGLGLNKAILAARRLYEIDPYLDVEVYPRGVTEQNMTAFLTKGGRVDLLVEECDEIAAKIALREQARHLRIPVVMETNDRGLLDVERFDLEPSRPILHGLIGDVTAQELAGLDTEAKIPFVLQIVGSLSPRAGASLLEIGQSLVGWPQLASGTTLGAAVVTDAVRRILLGQLRESGRHYIDLEVLVRDGDTSPLRVREEPVRVPEPSGPQASGPKPASPSLDADLSYEDVCRLVRRATTAPSGGNMQPWRFVCTGTTIDLWLDRSRSGSLLDFECASSYLALGSAAEALSHAASALARQAVIAPFPRDSAPDLACRIELTRRSPALNPTPLESSLESRCTNRKLGARRPMDPEHRRKLEDAARSCDAVLELVADPEALSEVGVVLGGVDRIRFLCSRLHSEVISELRWTREEVSRTGDGIDVATLELDSLGMAALRLVRDQKAAAVLRTVGQGAGLEVPAKRSVASASAVGLLTVQGTDRGAYFRGGMAVERVWLTATALGLAFQPLAVAPYLFARLERGGAEGLTSTERASLSRLRTRFSGVFHTDAGRAEVLLFRLAQVEPPAIRSLRRPLDDVLFWA